jgi:hypothetical protein
MSNIETMNGNCEKEDVIGGKRPDDSGLPYCFGFRHSDFDIAHPH